MTVAAQRLHTDRVFEMLRQSEHLQCRRRQALAIFSLIVILYIDFSCADNPNNNAENTTIPVTGVLQSLMAPLQLVDKIINTAAGMDHDFTMIIKEPVQLDLDNIENVMKAANQKSTEKPVVADNAIAVQPDDVQSDSVPYQYMQSHLATTSRRLANFYRFGGSG